VMDVAAIAEQARARGVKVVIDNTYGPSLFRPFDHGCAISVNAATKYIGGHSDLMMGIAAAADQETYRLLKKSVAMLGCPPGSDDAYLALRGLRTLGVRIKQHGITGMTLARWLESRPEVIRVMHPGLESHPQHELFMRQFTGPCGLFGLQLVEGYSRAALDHMLDGMHLFSMGFSWGGYESLIMANNINSARTVDKWKYGDGYGQTLRIHAGLEDVDDLIRDLEAGFDRLNSFDGK
jgi:cysteine-S-conjugate beta-lyase